jgi:ubiquinone/menaquinone biosynthesis C-methylase UbiE
MGFYHDHVLPRVVDCACGTAELHKLRGRITQGLCGVLIEIGFGSGHNVQHYPTAVDTVYAVEPSVAARHRSRRRVEASSIPIRHLDVEAESIPLEDDSCDSALSTFTLCTITEVEIALAELRRVLKPEGQFHFLEHGQSPDPKVATWQRRFEPLQKRLAGGCHLTRSPTELIEQSGFKVIESTSHDGAGPKPWTWYTSGIAVNPVGRGRRDLRR